MRSLWVLCLVSAAMAAAEPQKTNPFAGGAQAAEEGRIIFRGSCGLCHGIRGAGGRGPDLTLGAYSVGDSDAALYNVIANGAQGTEMPDFAGRFDEPDIWRLVSYIRSIAQRDPPRLTGDARSGEKLFWGKGTCGQCHMVRAKGGRMGPDLTRAGRLRSYAYLLESVLSPHADITPGYPTITVVKRDGKTIAGAQRGFDNFSAQLLDTADNYYSFLRSDVTSMKREFRSLMPDNYRTVFSEAELHDLLAYLAGLRGEDAKP